MALRSVSSKREVQKLSLYFQIGQMLGEMESGAISNAHQLALMSRSLMTKLQISGVASTYSIANDQIPDFGTLLFSRQLTVEEKQAFKATIRAVAKSMHHELDKAKVIQLNAGKVSASLRGLPSARKLNNAQKKLLKETIRCLECDSFRAAIVMGWNLAYDFVRQWIFDKHLKPFNTSLQTTCVRSGGAPKYKAVSAYDDFFEGPSEREVIDTCEAANLIKGKQADSLRFHLRKRNEFAHPSGAEATVDKANAFIQELIEIMKALK